AGDALPRPREGHVHRSGADRPGRGAGDERPGRPAPVVALRDGRLRARRHLLEGARLDAPRGRLRRRPLHRARGSARSGHGGARADGRSPARRDLDGAERVALVARGSAEPDDARGGAARPGRLMKLSMIHWMRQEPLEQTVERLAAAGYDGLEINGEPDLYDTGEVRDLLERHGIELWGAVTLMEHGGRDLVHPDRYVRIGTQRY